MKLSLIVLTLATATTDAATVSQISSSKADIGTVHQLLSNKVSSLSQDPGTTVQDDQQEEVISLQVHSKPSPEQAIKEMEKEKKEDKKHKIMLQMMHDDGDDCHSDDDHCDSCDEDCDSGDEECDSCDEECDSCDEE